MKVSIITVCKNSEKFIEKAIQSVLDQSYGEIEYILLDGGSTDGTFDIVQKYKNYIHFSLSETDKGIYDAMNKGIKRATGDILYFLNSDDTFYDKNVVSDIVTQFNFDHSLLIYGNVCLTDTDISNTVKYDKVNKKFFLHNTICHQASFSRKFLFQDIGLYDNRYTIYADLDWLLRAYLKYSNFFRYYDRVICYYSYQGISAKAFHDMKYVSERMSILSKYFLTTRMKWAIKKFLKLA